jgi:hypothetical protein
MFGIVVVVFVVFIVMTSFVLFIDKLSESIEIQFHSTHHNRQYHEYEDGATEKLVD